MLLLYLIVFFVFFNVFGYFIILYYNLLSVIDHYYTFIVNNVCSTGKLYKISSLSRTHFRSFWFSCTSHIVKHFLSLNQFLSWAWAWTKFVKEAHIFWAKFKPIIRKDSTKPTTRNWCLALYSKQFVVLNMGGKIYLMRIIKNVLHVIHYMPPLNDRSLSIIVGNSYN